MQWVNAEVKQPKDFVNVLIFKLGKWDEAGMGYYAQGTWYAWTEGVEQTEITHWMPLPEPPTASNNEFKATKAP